MLADSKNDFPCPQHGTVPKHVMFVVVRFCVSPLEVVLMEVVLMELVVVIILLWC